MAFLSSLFGGVKGLDNNTQSLLNSLPQQQSLGTANTKQGLATSNKGVDALGQAGDYFKNILGGSRTDTEKLLGPQVSTILGQYDSALKSGAELGPRGGGRTNAIEAAKTGKAGAYGTLLGGAQQTAAGGLGQIGSAIAGAGKDQASIGLGETGQAIGQVGSLAGTTSSTANNVFKNSSAFGSALGNLIG